MLDYIQMSGNLFAAFVLYGFFIARPQQYIVESIKSIMHSNVIYVQLKLKTLGISECISKFAWLIIQKLVYSNHIG